MYSVLRRGASTSFFALAACLTGCGGSGVAGPDPVAVPIPQRSLSDAAECQSVEQIESSPPVYRCERDGGPVFVATLRDCQVSEKFSFQATTRQLFVGVTGLKVISQAPVAFGGRNTLQTLVTGTLDAQPLSVSTFTYREHGCVNDVVVWRIEGGPVKEQGSPEAFATLSQSLAERVLGASMEPRDARS